MPTFFINEGIQVKPKPLHPKMLHPKSQTLNPKVCILNKLYTLKKSLSRKLFLDPPSTLYWTLNTLNLGPENPHFRAEGGSWLFAKP